MLAIRPILTSGQQGADIANLHLVLDTLGFAEPVSQQERADKRFGDGTADAVRRVQAQFNIQTHQPGVVDDPTANVMNEQLFTSGAFRLVRGRVTKADGSSVAGNLIFAFDNENLGGAYLGSANTNTDGAYQMYYDPSLYAQPGEGILKVKAVIDLIVQVYDAAGSALATSPPVHDPSPEVQIDLQIAKLSVGKSFVVHGEVRQDGGLPYKGSLVRAFHQATDAAIPLGQETSDAEGRYMIRYETLPSVEAINLRVAVSDANGRMLRESDVIKEAKPVEMVNLTVPIISRPSNQRRLEGRIVLDNGLPAEKLKLRLYRIDFGGVATLVGNEVETRELGLYVLPFDLGDRPAGLEVRAVDSAGNETPLSKPMHDLGDEPRIIINLVAPATLQPLPAEYQRLTADLTPHVGEIKALAGARENAERQDLTVLNRITGWDARLIALAANAEKLSADPAVQLPQEALYGLLRAGLPSDKLLLAQIKPEVVEQVLNNVREAGIVGLGSEQVSDFKAKFEVFVSKERLAVPVPGSPSTYGELLKDSGLNEDAQNNFAQVYLNQSRDGDLWNEATKAGLNDGQIQTLQRQGKLAFLAGNSKAITSRLMQKELPDLSLLVQEELYQAEKWEAEVKRVAGVSPEIAIEQLSEEDSKKLQAVIPPTYASETTADSLRSYAADMARKVRLSYPTQVMARRIEQDNVDEFNLGEAPARTATAQLLRKAAAEGFRLGQTPIETFVRSHPAILDGLGDTEGAKQHIKTLQRVYQITPSDESMSVLMKLGLTSAYDIVALSQDMFLARYGHHFPTQDEAKLVYRKAQQVSSVTFNLFTIAKKLDSEAPVYGVSAPAEVRESVRNELIKQFPTMESLFGSMDFCECEHCRSVLSPAAYLVDLLQFVDAEPEVWGNFLTHWKATHNNEDYTVKYKKPYDALIDRRPDILHIPLTCENTHTALPYIDVVNEILEYYVAKGKLEEQAAHDSGETSTAELLAEPQNVIAEAYDKLVQARYPLALPFDLWIETVRSFCDYFETPLWQLLENFCPNNELFAPIQPYDRSVVFIESLGLSSAEYAIFTDPDLLKDDKWYELYGGKLRSLAPAAIYGYTTANPAIGNSTNTENAAVTVPDADATEFRVGDPCTYFDVSANAVPNETKTISEIGVNGSGGSGQTIMKFTGTWTIAPEAGDRLIFDSPGVLKSAKALSRRLGVTYKEILEIVQTGFVNPKLANLVILSKLGVTIQDARFYKDHKTFYEQNKDLLGKDRISLSGADQKRFDELTKINPTTKKTGWEDLHEVQGFEQRLKGLSDEFKVPLTDLESKLQVIAFGDILVLADPDASCNFDLTTLRCANGDPADAIVFLKVNLFVRLWRKLGWTIEETDRALQVFLPANSLKTINDPNETGAKRAAALGTAFKTALLYMAHLKALDEHIKLGKNSRLKLITLWSNLSTTGKHPLYAQLFLTRSVLKSGEVFDDVARKHLSVFDDPLGEYLETGLAGMAERVKHQVSRGNVAPSDKIDPAAFAGQPKVFLNYDSFRKVQSLAYRGILSDTDKGQLLALSNSPELVPLLDAVQAKGKEFTLIQGHLLAVQGALGLTTDEIDRILTDAGTDLETAKLSLATVSLIYRYGLLAKALKLSVRELITLKQLSGQNPFKPLEPEPLVEAPEGGIPQGEALKFDYPYAQTLRFVEMAEQVKGSGLKIEDLEYLLRHRFDETGKYRSNNDATLSILKTLSEGVRAIRIEHAVPAEPGSMNEETLRQKLGLALPSDVVARFLAMMNGTIEFTATKPGVLPENKLDPQAFKEEPSIREVSYNDKDPRKIQKLTIRGVLFQTEKDRLKTRFPSKVFADLLDDLGKQAVQAKRFFDTHLLKQKLRLDGEAGFLADGDFKTLFEPLKLLLKIAPGDTEQQSKDKQEENEKISQENQATLRERCDLVAQAFLPFLQQRLIRQFIVQTIQTQLGADPPFVEALLTDARLLGDPQPLLEAFTALSERGVSAVFFDGAGAKLEAKLFVDVDTGLKGKDGPLRLVSATGALFEGYLEVPTPGAYRFYVAFEKKNAKAELRFDHLPQVFMSGTAASDGAEVSEYLELKSGVPYRFTFEATELNSGDVRMLVQGETLPKDSLAQLMLYPQPAVERADRAMLLLKKVVQLIQSLNLTEREVRYLVNHAADFSNLNLSPLPTVTSSGEDVAALNKAQELFEQFLRLAGYARLKHDLAGGTDDLISLFETDAIDKVYALIAQLTRRDETTVKATARALFGDKPRFKDELALRRLWDALQVVERFGVPVASMIGWTRIVSATATPEQRFAIARDLKEAIKARFEPEGWQRVAQAIFDKLRQRQRDALVAQVMHQHGFARMEELYEYFLLDPGMEPVVQTSRIRLAISSVQLFIQRCLINLEKHVPPSVINAKQWEWMKRYRVWEANRKLFLFPENWLEPEFRDDKTHLFRELEGNLLQGDVSSDLVEDAFLNYLKKLEELARLDLVAMHLEDNPDPALRILHVIGRTYSLPHKHFYRRYTHQMWTPWEPVTAEIEGDHLAPVVWRDRLYLFWVTFMEKPELPTGSGYSAERAAQGEISVTGRAKIWEEIIAGNSFLSGEGGAETTPQASNKEPPLASMTLSQVTNKALNSAGKRTIEAQLHWSEYLQGEWKTHESGGSSAPGPMVAKGVKDFTSKDVFIHVSKEPFENGEERGVYIHLGGAINQAFYLAGRNSIPEGSYREPEPEMRYPSSPQVNRYQNSGALKVNFKRQIATEDGRPPVDAAETPSILGQGGNYFLLPCNNDIKLGFSSEESLNSGNAAAVAKAIERGLAEIASLTKPVFYQDRAYTFFIEPNVQERTIEEWSEWVTRTPQPEPGPIPSERMKEYVKPMIPKHKLPILADPGDPIWHSPIKGESLIEMKSDQDWLVNQATGLRFDDEVIGSTGRTGLTVLPAADVMGALSEGGKQVSVHVGSELASGSAVFTREGDALKQAGSLQRTGRLNIVGGSGFNSALVQNFDSLKRFGFGVGKVGGKLIEP